MADVLRRLFGPQKVLVQDQRIMGLEAAREILAEVFGIRLSEADEMIEYRFLVREERRSKEDGLWPQEFWIEK